jgi:subfamily B ATP-binding cassette protein MsbA
MKLVVILSAAMVTSCSWFTISYLRKVMVDDVLQVQVGRSTQTLSEAGGDRGNDRSLRDGGGRTRDEGSPHSRDISPGRSERPMSTKAERLQKLWWIFLAYVSFRVFFAALNWGYSYGIAQVGQELVFKLRQDVYNKLQRLQLSYFDRYQTGKIMARVMDDVNAVQASISNIFIRFFTDVATLIIGVGILFHIHSGLASIALVTLPCYVIIYQVFLRKIRVINTQIRERNAAVYGAIGDSVRGVRVVMAFAREVKEYRRFFKSISDYFRLQIRNSVLNTALSVLCGLVSGVGTTVVFYYGILAIRDGAMSLGDFLYFYGSIGFLFSPVVSLSNMNISIQQVAAALNRVFDVLDEDITIYEPEGAVQMAEMHGEVVFHNVSLKYNEKDDYALKQLNFAVVPGQMVCLVGASGGGKSSLVNLFLRLYQPTEGKITVDGEDIKNVSLHSLRKHIRMVPQEPVLFSGTLAENIKYGYQDARPEDVMRAAQWAELHDHIMTLPAKYESHIGEGGVSLSGGQKQRMAIAMTLMTDPSVLILDDSTSALDAKTESRIHSTLDRILENRTSFVVTHKVSMARKADLILVLEKGKIVEKGTHERLVARRGTYYSLFETQLSDSEKGVAEKELVVA